ncbi:hypothetical protein EII20_03405 [Comamonadaceae bacterium OH2545_COT-014]|nr:hypothetical protein EII20_03405 [Comamonadaceae bacterium OH2545_COT-014]
MKHFRSQAARRLPSGTWLAAALVCMATLPWQTAHAQPAPAQPVPLQAQTSSQGGWHLRAKSLAAQPDHTVLHLHVSFANQRRPQGAQLANSDTFLLTDHGERLWLKRPDDDRVLQIANNASVEKTLTFLGAIPAGTQHVTLVVNEGNAADSVRGPSLRLPIALPPPLQAQLKVRRVGADPATLDASARYPVQAGNAGGLLVQVQSVHREANHTRLAVSVAYSHRRRPEGTQLAGGETYLRTASGQRFMLQRPPDSPTLPLANNSTFTGDLRFQGVLPADAKGLALVINEGFPADSTRASGMVMALPAP